MKIQTFILTLLFAYSASGQTVTMDWVRQMGGYKQDHAQCVTTDRKGNVIITGVFRDTADFDPGPGVSILIPSDSGSIFIAKLDPAGKLIWAKSLRGVAKIGYEKVTTDVNNNILLAGYFMAETDFDPGPMEYLMKPAFQKDAFVLKLDQDGNFLWADQLFSGGTFGVSSAHDIATDSNGSIFIAGALVSPAYLITGSGPSKLSDSIEVTGYLMKLDAAGKLSWIKKNPGFTNCRRLALDREGNILSSGEFMVKTDFDPGPAVYNLTPVGGYDIFISKLDTAGNLVWAKSIGGSGTDMGYGLSTDKWCNTTVCGFYELKVDFDPSTSSKSELVSPARSGYILSLDKNGNFRWVRELGSQTNMVDIVTDTFGNNYAIGSFSKTISISPKLGGGSIVLSSGWGPDLIVTMLTNLGDFVWAKGTLSEGVGIGGSSIALHGNNNIYVTGSIGTKVKFDFGDDKSTEITPLDTSYKSPYGPGDIFVLKLVSDNTNLKIDNSDYPNASLCRVFPNPGKEKIRIDYFELVNVQVSDLSGRVLKITKNVNEIDIQDLAPGPFLLHITNTKGENLVTKQFIKVE